MNLLPCPSNLTHMTAKAQFFMQLYANTNTYTCMLPIPCYNSLPLIFCWGEKTAQAAFLWPTHPSYLVVIWGAQVNQRMS